jgi:hypothetical protein
MLIGLVTGAFAIEKPSGYKDLIVKKNGISSYQSNDGKIYVIDAPLWKFKLDFSSIGDSAGKNSGGNLLFTKKDISEHYNEMYNSNLYAVLNGQFFSRENDITSLSFPTKGDNKVFQAVHHEPEKKKRTLYMYKGVYPIFYNGYSKGLLENSKITDVITSLNPEDTKTVNEFQPNKKIGRHYIACVPLKEYNTNLATCKNLLFFYSDNATHNDMMNAAKKWGIKKYHIMMMDGSGSAQLYSEVMTESGIVEKHGLTRWKFPDYRPLPNVISIFNR